MVKVIDRFLLKQLDFIYCFTYRGLEKINPLVLKLL